MKTLFCFSDTHGAPVPERLKAIMAESDKVVFCGDGPLSDRAFFVSLSDRFVEVTGNCDGRVRSIPEETTLKVEGVRVLVTHGHNYRVKSDLLELFYRAKELDCNFVLYGHTHAYDLTENGGVTLLGVGSLGHGFMGENGYAYVVIDGSKIFAKFVKIF